MSSLHLNNRSVTNIKKLFYFVGKTHLENIDSADGGKQTTKNTIDLHGPAASQFDDESTYNPKTEGDGETVFTRKFKQSITQNQNQKETEPYMTLNKDDNSFINHEIIASAHFGGMEGPSPRDMITSDSRKIFNTEMSNNYQGDISRMESKEVLPKSESRETNTSKIKKVFFVGIK